MKHKLFNWIKDVFPGKCLPRKSEEIVSTTNNPIKHKDMETNKDFVGSQINKLTWFLLKYF
jgi:hypothetical protein